MGNAKSQDHSYKLPKKHRVQLRHLKLPQMLKTDGSHASLVAQSDPKDTELFNSVTGLYICSV